MMYKKSKIKVAVSLYILIFVCLYSYSQDKDKRYLKGFCQVSKTKHHYTVLWVLNMKYSFVVCDAKGTVLDKITNSTTSLAPKGGAGGSGGNLDYNLVIIEQDNDKGIFVFDIMMRYKGKIYQAKIKKLIPFNSKKTEFFSLNINDYVKDPKLLKKLDEYYTKKMTKARDRIMNPPYPFNTPPFKIVPKEPSVAKRRRNITKRNRAPQFKKDSLKKYLRDEAKGLNTKDSTNVERIKRDLPPILSLLRKPITWEVNPERVTE